MYECWLMPISYHKPTLVKADSAKSAAPQHLDMMGRRAPWLDVKPGGPKPNHRTTLPGWHDALATGNAAPLFERASA